jgi:putative glutamine amidotransferase
MRAPLILVTPCQQNAGAEFADDSLSLSNRYTQAIADAGGLPLVLPLTTTPGQLADCVARADGVLLTGGEDIELHHYKPEVSAEIAATVKHTEPRRDAMEFALVDEVFRQRTPLLCICRGHQVLNVALGGKLVVDIASQVGDALRHKQLDRKMEPVHDIAIERDSRLAALLGETTCGVNSTHHQAVSELAPKLRPTARSCDGVVEAMELKDPAELPFLVSVQFHPERLYDRWPKFANLFREFVSAAGRGR